MKKILPGIIIFIITVLSRADKYILVGLFLVFPIIFIMQGLMYSDLKKDIIQGFIISSIGFIVPVNLLYNMGSCVEFLIIYNVLGIISYCIKNKVICKEKVF
ncbi:MAG: hypothetical protein ACRDAU_05290 [Clostridium sp.]